jgi:hypothetical protein
MSGTLAITSSSRARCERRGHVDLERVRRLAVVWFDTMTHRSVLRRIVIDVGGGETEQDREVAFWEGVTGQTLHRSDRHPEYHGAELPGSAIGLLVQRLGSGPSRVHVDIHTDDVGAEVARLEQIGAQRVEDHEHWTVMRDPAGLPFCVVIDHALNDSNSHIW